MTCPTVSVCLLKLRPGVLSKTLSHIWGKLNLPMFLFNVGMLTVSTDPQVVSTSASLAGCSQQDSTSQAASTSSQTHSTNSQGASATLPRLSKLAGSPIVLVPPGDRQEATQWKTQT